MRCDIRETVKKYRIIDSHGHIGYYKLFNNPGCDAENMVRTMDRLGIEKICVSAITALESDYRHGNDMVADAVKKHGDRILGYACVNPYEKDDMIPELERCFDRLNMTAIKIHPDLIEYPADGMNNTPIYEFANERKLVVMNHSWGSGRNLAHLAEKYPDIKFIQAHYASAWDGNEELEIFKAVREYDNVYVDNAGSGDYLGAFEKTVEYFGEDKIVFGTDFSFFDARVQLGNVLLSDISETAKVKILGINFLKLIGMES